MLQLCDSRLWAATGASVVLLVAYYYAVYFGLKVRGKEQTERQRSWVLTLLSSAVMTIASVPYLWTWFKTGEVDLLHRLADYCSCFFIAYLATDLVIGSIHYKSSISLLTGWIHHTAYITLLTLIVLPYAYAPLFTLCCILELPTFLLALGSLTPRLRNDYVFAVTFFLTRIVLHVYIAATYATRAWGGSASWTPALALAAALPMHIAWMHACIRGIIRRRSSSPSPTPTPEPKPTPGVNVTNAGALRFPPRLASRARTLLARMRRPRQHVLRLLRAALREDGVPLRARWGEVRWGEVRRRVVGLRGVGGDEVGAGVSDAE